MRGRYLILFLVLFLLVIIIFSFASIDQSRPSQFSDSGIAVNESAAYDDNSGTYSYLNTSGGNNSYQIFTVGSHQNDEDVKQVSVFFDIEVTGLVDDEWALQYSEDDGITWNNLRSLQSGNLARQVINYSDIQEITDNKWTWGEIRNDLLIRVQTVPVTSVDSASIKLYEIYLNVSYDDRGPSIILESPENNLNISDSNLTFTYNVTDLLSNITNCSLVINGSINLSNFSVSENVNQYFNQSFSEGIYSWNIFCHDNASTYNSNISEERIFTVDYNSPSIQLQSPGNASTYSVSNNVIFQYLVSDISEITNCSLMINDSINDTVWSVPRSLTQEFNFSLENGDYSWAINCTDEKGFNNQSETRTLTVDVNTPPQVDWITLDQNISLIVGSRVEVLCNSSVSDADSGAELDQIVATLYFESSSAESADENSTHYTNASCTRTDLQAFSKTYSCGFNVWYYARQGTWYCGIQINDTNGDIDSDSENTSVMSLYGLNITPQRIDYGALYAGNTSQTDVEISVSNLGNMEVDITLDGYAIFDGDGLAMNCTNGDINLSYERYSLESGMNFNSMIPLTDDAEQVDDFNLGPRNDSFNGSKSTYWKIRVPKPQKGACDGFVTFSAVAS